MTLLITHLTWVKAVSISFGTVQHKSSIVSGEVRRSEENR